jgi:GTPase SAR1 family protein
MEGEEEGAGHTAFATYAAPLKVRSKICLVGEQGAGKSALASVFANGIQAFPKEYKATYGVETLIKDVRVQDDRNESVEYLVVDCAGCPAGHEYLSAQFEEAGCFIFVYDCMRPETLAQLGLWYSRVAQARQAARGDGASILGVAVAAKVDLKDRAQVDTIEMGRQFAANHGLEFFEVSAQQGSVEDPFRFLAQYYLRLYEDRRSQLENYAF